MNRMSKSVASLLIAGGAVGAWFGGQTLVRDVAFANQQRDVETSREQLSTANDLTTAFRNVGKVVEPSVVNIEVRKTIKGNRRMNIPDDMLRRFFRDRAPDNNNNNNNNNGDEGDDNQNDGAPEDGGFEQVGTGSGVIMEVDGKTAYILTNNHVAGGASEMLVTLSDGRHIENAKLVGADAKTDLAVVKIQADHLIAAKWGDSATLQKGDWILAFGSPFGYVGSMTHGIVSALDRTNIGILGQYGYEDFIQVDAPINPGNSGGPLVNLQGQVVGINTAIASRSGGFQGIGFAIPSNEAKFVYGELKNHGKVTRGWLGVSINDVSREVAKARYLKYTGSDGVFVEDELPNSPAVGKLQNDDIITAINGKPVKNTLELRTQIASMTPGSEVKMTVVRNGKDQDVSIKLGEQPEDLAAVARGGNGAQRGPGNANTAETFGMRLANPDERLQQRFGLNDVKGGAIVVTVAPRSEAAKAGIRPGDVITEVDRKTINDAKQATDLISKHDVKKGVLVRIASPDGTSRSVLIGGDANE
jgi:serine protease Do